MTGGHVSLSSLSLTVASMLLIVAPPAWSQGDLSADSPLTADSPLVELLLSQDWTRAELAHRLLQALEVAAFQPDECIPGEEMFDDVPAASPFCKWIEELVRRGLTAGCQDDLYCPTDPVNRQQMAVFLVRAIEAAIEEVPEGPPGAEGPPGPQGPEGPPGPTGESSASFSALDGFLDDFFPPEEFTEILSTMVEAPGDGFLVVSAVYNGEWDVDSEPQSSLRVRSRVTVDGAPFGTQPFATFRGIGGFGGQDASTVPIDAVVPVTAGPHTVALEIARISFSGSPMMFIHSASITTTFAHLGDIDAGGAVGASTRSTGAKDNE